MTDKPTTTPGALALEFIESKGCDRWDSFNQRRILTTAGQAASDDLRALIALAERAEAALREISEAVTYVPHLATYDDLRSVARKALADAR